MTHCPFCKKLAGRETFAESALAGAIWDGFPVSEGHALLVPKRHVGSFFELSETEQSDMLRLLSEVHRRLVELHHPTGFNVGLNIGKAAGQTVDHAHLHVIPRYNGDVRDPRGGIRHVIPTKARYWER